jgi:transposase
MAGCQAFRLELDPANVSRGGLASHAGGAKFAFRWGLRLVKSRLDQASRIREQALAEGASPREAEVLARTVDIPWSLYSLRQEWNRAKNEVAVSQTAGCWYVSFGCEVQRSQPAQLPEQGRVVGVDSGVSCLAVLSAGEMVPSPGHLSRYARRLAGLQAQQSRRHGPARHGNRPSKRWCRTVTRVARVHARVARARAGGLGKLTTTLAKTHETVAVEDLNVAGMTASAEGSGHWRGKAGLNRAILDVAPADLRRQLS